MKQTMELGDFLLIAELVLNTPAETVRRVTKLGLAESALAAPHAGFGEVDLYTTVDAKAAVLCSRIVRNHPLPDGNKRVAYLAMREFLARHGYEWTAPADQRAQMIERLAAREISEGDFMDWVHRYAVP